jgi:hypothetical protein
MFMAIHPKKRQKKLEKKASRRKAVKASARAAQPGGKWPTAAYARVVGEFPVHECLVPEGLFELGIGSVFFSRQLPEGIMGVSIFLVDVYCLGVKNALFEVIPDYEYGNLVERFRGNEVFEKADPACARKLVEGAEAYARGLGLEPHPDYELAKKVFGDIDVGLCPVDFTFGDNGMPHFLSGPNDSPAKCARILETLTERLGREGFKWNFDAAPEEFSETSLEVGGELEEPERSSED